VGKEHLVYYIPYKVRSKNQPSNNCLGRDGISNFNLNTDTSYKCNLREKLSDPLDGHTYWDFRTSSCQSMVCKNGNHHLQLINDRRNNFDFFLKSMWVQIRV
jgi:hypothetical protein